VSILKVLKFEKPIADDPTQLYYLAARCIWCAGVVLWPYWVISKKDWVRRVMTNSYKFDDGIHWALLPTKNWVKQ